MAWLAVNEVCKDESYEGAPTSREESREFIVKSDADVRPFAVRLATDGVTTVPLVGDFHPTDTTSKCIKVKIARMHEGAGSPAVYAYRVLCDYSTATSATALATSPLLRPWEFDSVSETTTEAYGEDKDPGGAKIVQNSAGEAFNESLQRLKKGSTITVTRNQAAGVESARLAYDKTVNSGSVTLDGVSYSAGSLLMTSINHRKVVENGVTYYSCTYTMQVSADGWTDKPLDIGTRKLVAGESVKIADGLAQEIEWPLDGAGAPMPNVTDAPFELEFWPYDEVSWAGLSFV